MRWLAVLLPALLLLADGGWAARTGRVGAAPWPGFSLPFDFAPGPQGDVWVLQDLQRRLVWGQRSGRVQRVDGLQAPVALAVDDDGLVLVVDRRAGGQLVLVTLREGRQLRAVALRGEPLPAAPVGAAAAAGILWLVERTPPRLLLYAYDGASLGWVDLAGLARAPFSIALGTAGEAFVTDPMGPAVLVFSPAGEYLGTLDLEGTGVTRPSGIAASPLGRIWVSDGVVGHLACLDSAGERTGLRCGDDLVRFRAPLRIKWQGGGLWVLEGESGRLHRVELEEP